MEVQRSAWRAQHGGFHPSNIKYHNSRACSCYSYSYPARHDVRDRNVFSAQDLACKATCSQTCKAVPPLIGPASERPCWFQRRAGEAQGLILASEQPVNSASTKSQPELAGPLPSSDGASGMHALLTREITIRGSGGLLHSSDRPASGDSMQAWLSGHGFILAAPLEHASVRRWLPGVGSRSIDAVILDARQPGS